MLSSYMEELKKIKLLSLAEEKALWQAKAAGDAAAHRQLVSAYQPLVFKTAMSFRLQENQVLELIQEGTVGLLEAAERFDYKMGVAFSVYAVHRIRGRMIDFLEKEYGGKLLSLDTETAAGSGVSWAECLVAGGKSPVEAAEMNFLTGKVEEAMGRLSEKEKQVVKGIYLEDRTAGDLAAAISVTPSHIYRLQKKGVKRLRGMLSRLMAELKND